MARRGGSRTSAPGRLRIVAGNWRSRLLRIADVEGLRPTSERVRETLFNWLSTIVPGSRCLDLFAGTGALGLEALSRGAKDTVFVEASRQAAKVLRDNIDELSAQNATLVVDDAFEYLERVEPGSFDVVFLDPPFAADFVGELCRLIDQRRIVSPGGRVYVEQERSLPEPQLPGSWDVLKNKTTGNVRYMLAEPGE